MKIISVDNFDREQLGVSDDRLVAENVTNEAYAKTMVDALNAKYCSTPHDDRFFKIVPDDYKLVRYEP